MNQNGWGLRKELFFILLFVICLLLATIGLSSFGILGDEEEAAKFYGTDYDETQYGSYETKVSSSALNYYNDKYPNGNENTTIITTKILQSNGYLGTLKDSYGKECRGYAKVTSSKAVISYIRCSRYKTDGYSRDNE